MIGATQLELPGLSSDPPGLDLRPVTTGDVGRLERALARRWGRRLVVKITKNRRHLVTGRVRAGVLHARIHVVFLRAPDAVLDAIASYFDPRDPRTDAEAIIQAFVAAHREALNQTRATRRIRSPRGLTHNLERILTELNRRFFNARLPLRITWSRAVRGQRRRSMQLGSYSPEEELIRIHPALDQAFVPAYFVSCVVFHEMLHAVHGVTKQGGRHRIHSAAFAEDERRHPDYARARRWEDKNLKRLLRY